MNIQINNLTFKNKMLDAVIKNSEKAIQEYRAENIFQSPKMRPLFSDEFEYTTDKKNKVIVEDAKTSKPIELDVRYFKIKKKKKNHWTELIQFLNEKGEEVGVKDFSLAEITNRFFMKHGFMHSKNSDLKGIGQRLDQLQIERALELGLDSVSRLTVADAIVYHAKMGFFPETRALIPIDYPDCLDIYLDLCFKEHCNIPKEFRTPIVIKKNGKYYLDENKTIAISEFKMAKKIKEQGNVNGIVSIRGPLTYLKLSGEELKRWKDYISKHPILPNIEH